MQTQIKSFRRQTSRHLTHLWVIHHNSCPIKPCPLDQKIHIYIFFFLAQSVSYTNRVGWRVANALRMPIGDRIKFMNYQNGETKPSYFAVGQLKNVLLSKITPCFFFFFFCKSRFMASKISISVKWANSKPGNKIHDLMHDTVLHKK